MWIALSRQKNWLFRHVVSEGPEQPIHCNELLVYAPSITPLAKVVPNMFREAMISAQSTPVAWQWLVADVQGWFVVQVADPHLHGYAELMPVPLTMLHSANWQRFPVDAHTSFV
jgi:hypothetical protein